MKIKKLFILSVVVLAVPVMLLQGCGGGGGGGSSPKPTSTPTAGARTLVVQLRGSSGNIVDGIVKVGSQIKATNDGQASFTNISSGNVNVTAEVNGLNTSGTADVKSSGTTTFVLTISSGVTPGPTTNPPPPPFE